MKDARATVNKARPSQSSLEIRCQAQCCRQDPCISLHFCPECSFRERKMHLVSPLRIPSRPLSNAWLRPGYNEQSPVTRANTTDRYLGRDDDAKWVMMLSRAVLQKAATTKILSQAVVICITMSEAVTMTIWWDPMMIESRWWCFS